MGLHSNHEEINYLMDTTELTHIDFSETGGADTDNTDIQYGGNQTDTEKLAQYEKEFYAIFNKSREYRQRLIDVQDRMLGGATRRSKKHRSKKSSRSKIHRSKKSSRFQSRDVTVEQPVKKKRPISKTLATMLAISKIIRETKKYPHIQQKNLMKIAKLIWDDAKKQTNNDADKAAEVAIRSTNDAKKLDEYISKWEKEQSLTKTM